MASAEDIIKLILESLQPDFEDLPEQVAHPLQEAAHSGMTQAQVSDAGMVGKADALARDWADDRAAELVGMKYDDAGDLVANPDAKWAITDTTREAINRIVTEAFSDPSTTMADIEAAIDDSGIFSADRARMIASTEVSRAQMQGTLSMWKATGMVETLAVELSADNPCDECKEIADGGPYTIEEIGPEFPFHPNCNCSLVPVDIAE